MPPRPVILIVEDDGTLREMYRLALSLSDFAVHACEDGVHALRYLDEEKPDLVVLDLNLPRVPGTMIYDELRARSQAGSVPPIVVVTGMYNVPYLPGATILRKPVAPETLRRTIVRLLERRRREWLFIAGAESVRIIRIEEATDRIRLILAGPGPSTEVYRDTDPQTGFRRQHAIERRLVKQGYRLLPFDRRSGGDRRAASRQDPDRRRSPDLVAHAGV
jgi:DNA-binding response OmpR family regulator